MAIAKITVDRPLCIGAASCVVIAPKVFALDSENKAIVLDPQGHDEQTILDAARSCPVAAIILHDKAGNQIWPEVESDPNNTPPKESANPSGDQA